MIKSDNFVASYQEAFLAMHSQKKIKVLQITHDLAIGGLQQVVVNICQMIDRNIFDVSVLCLRGLGEFVPEIKKLGIRVWLLPQRDKGTDYFSFIKVANILRSQQIDVIHTHNTQPFVDGTLGSLLSGVKTIIHTDHGRTFPDKIRYMVAENLMSRFAYKVVGVSEHTSKNLISYEKISPNKVMTIENGINENRFNIAIDTNKKRKELGITGNGPIIGLAVRLVKLKGITYLLQALPQIIQSFPDITLLIIGDGDSRIELQEEAVRLGVAGHVVFLGPRLDIPELLKVFDIYVLPSLSEGMPMVLLEAFAAGCPVVATNVGGISKVIDDQINGLLVPPKNPELFACAVIRLLADEQLRRKFIDKGLQKFDAHFGARKMTKKYENLYLRVL